MNIGIPLRELGAVDSTALREAVLAQEDQAWHEDSYRQEAFEVHHATRSIVLLFVDIDRWPDIIVKIVLVPFRGGLALDAEDGVLDLVGQAVGLAVGRPAA